MVVINPPRADLRGDALEEEGPQRRPQRRLSRRLEDVAEAVGIGYCRLQMPLKLALASGGTLTGHRLPWRAVGGGGGGLPPFQCIPAPSPPLYKPPPTGQHTPWFWTPTYPPTNRWLEAPKGGGGGMGGGSSGRGEGGGGACGAIWGAHAPKAKCWSITASLYLPLPSL